MPGPPDSTSILPMARNGQAAAARLLPDVDPGRVAGRSTAADRRPPTADLGPGELTTAASRHGDAHLVEYTLAALAAADYDPAYRALHLAAADRLHEWWWEQPDDGFFGPTPGRPVRPWASSRPSPWASPSTGSR